MPTNLSIQADACFPLHGGAIEACSEGLSGATPLVTAQFESPSRSDESRRSGIAPRCNSRALLLRGVSLRSTPRYRLASLCDALGIWLVLLICIVGRSTVHAGEPVNIGSRLELFVDHHLVGKLDGCALKLHEPTLANIAIRFDAPWEGPFSGYQTIIKDGDTYRLYYRGSGGKGGDGGGGETTCMAESRDGITFTKPKLGLCEFNGGKDNNIVIHEAPFTHNFCPFIDTNPAAPKEQRFKAVAGTAKTGLVAWSSPDGIRWTKMQDKAVFTKGAFDSQNVAFWSEAEQCYCLYFRVFTGGTVNEKQWQPKGYRTVSRATSKDFLNWSEGKRMTFGDTPPEHLYTNGTRPYFRAPHLYIAVPMRFLPGRKVLTDEQANALGVKPGYGSDCAEAVLMSSRGDTLYDRTFMEAWIRPGTDLGNWASRAGLTALGIVPTSNVELSLYKQAHYAQATTHMLRYTLRTDGFASVNAPYRGGEFVTKPLTFTGGKLTMNFSTGATGGVRVEIQDAQGKPAPGFSLDDAVEQIGDDIERTVTWKNGGDVSNLAGQAVKTALRDEGRRLVCGAVPVDAGCSIARRTLMSAASAPHSRKRTGVSALLRQLLAPLRRLAHGLDQRIPQPLLFQLFQARDGRAAGTGDFVAQRCGMFAGLQDHLRGSGDGLRGKLQRRGAGQAHKDTAVSQGLDHGVDIRGAASAEARDGVEQAFRNFAGGSDRTEDRLRGRGIGVRGGAAAGEGGRALEDERGGVGHGSDDPLRAAKPGLKVLERDAGGDGEEQGVMRDA